MAADSDCLNEKAAAELLAELGDNDDELTLELLKGEAGVVAIKGLCGGGGFTSRLLALLQQHEKASGKLLNASGVGLWERGFGPVFERLGRRLQRALQQHSEVRRALGLDHTTTSTTNSNQDNKNDDDEKANELLAADGYAIRYVADELIHAEQLPALEVDSRHPWHTDDCLVTVNVCLGVAPFEGGQLELDLGYEHGGQLLRYEHVAGQALVHPGKLRHQALPLLAGTRYNLLVWFNTGRTARALADRGVLVVRELVETERVYLRSLHTLTEQFADVRSAAKELAELFVYVEHLKTFHAALLHIFEQLLEHAAAAPEALFSTTTTGGGDERSQPVAQAIAAARALFLQNVHYYSAYLGHYDAAVARIASDKAVQKLLANVKSSLDIQSYLVCPCRRIPRYLLLFTDLERGAVKRLHMTHGPLPSQTPLLELGRLIDDIRYAASAVNERRRVAEAAQAGRR